MILLGFGSFIQHVLLVLAIDLLSQFYARII